MRNFITILLLVPFITRAQDIPYRDVPEKQYHIRRLQIIDSIRTLRDSIHKSEPNYADSILKYIPANGNLADTDGTYYGYFLRLKRGQAEEVRLKSCPFRWELWTLNHTFYKGRTIVGDRHENCAVWIDPGDKPKKK